MLRTVLFFLQRSACTDSSASVLWRFNVYPFQSPSYLFLIFIIPWRFPNFWESSYTLQHKKSVQYSLVFRQVVYFPRFELLNRYDDPGAP